MRIGGLSLHQLTALDSAPRDLVAIAGDLGCQHVSLFTFVPPRGVGVYPEVTEAAVPALRDAMRGAGVTLSNLEVFPIDGSEDWDGFERSLAIGAALGANRATVQPHAIEQVIAVDHIARFCDLAKPYGISAGLEFNRFSSVPDITTAIQLIRAVGRTNANVALDMLHLARFGDGPDKVLQAADLVSYVQLNDGPLIIADEDRWHEAVRERGIPGTGEFPLVGVLRMLDPTNIVFDAEVPQARNRKAGMSAADRCRLAIDGARLVLRQAYGEDII